MALSFPLSSAEFADLLRVQEVVFDSPENVEQSMTAGGEIITAELAPRLWTGQVALAPAYFHDASAIAARIDLLRKPGASFFIRDSAQLYPYADPFGATLGAATPSLKTVNVNARELSLQGLPAGYVLTAGDYLAFSYSSTPTLYALHRLIEDVTADGAGDTAEFEVTPHIRAGAATSDPVTLVKPSCKAVMIPGSFNPGTKRDRITSGMSFRWNQTLG